MNLDGLSFLLAVVSATATFAGIGLALYGFFNVNFAKRLVKEQLGEFEEKLREQLARSQEAQQKITSAYNLINLGQHEAAVSLLQAAVEIDSKAFNGYTALAYEYWALDRKQEALECFNQAIREAPKRAEPFIDLARFYTNMGETGLALKNLQEALDRNQSYLASIEDDTGFDRLRQEEPVKMEQLLRKYQ